MTATSRNSQLHGLVLIRTSCNRFSAFTGIGECTIALDDNASRKLYFTFDRQLRALLQRWHAIRDNCVHSIYELVAIVELDERWHIGLVESPQWQAAMREQTPHLLSMRRKPGSAEYQVVRVSLAKDRARVGELRPEVVRSIWASAALELKYLTNDDDERYSIQAHPTLLRNLIVQSAEYPIYVSPPTTVWL